MKNKVEGIVLRNPVRHSDRADVLTVYSPDRGRLSVVVPAGVGRTVRHRKAALMPLSVIEFQMSEAGEDRLARAGSITPVVTYSTLYFDPIKSAVGMMLSEFLNRLLRESSPDSSMYSYITRSIQLLDDVTDARRIANFHICFLAGLTIFAGIAPDVGAYSPGALFDMEDGRYTTMPPVHRNILTGRLASVPGTLARMNYSNMHVFRFSRSERRELLEGILRYYGLHFPGCDNLKSLEILFSLFD